MTYIDYIFIDYNLDYISSYGTYTIILFIYILLIFYLSVSEITVLL